MFTNQARDVKLSASALLILLFFFYLETFPFESRVLYLEKQSQRLKILGGFGVISSTVVPKSFSVKQHLYGVVASIGQDQA